MATSTPHHDELAAREVVYPESDGLPMSDNTEQFEWIVTLQGNLDAIRADDFVGGDILWYPVEGRPDIRIGPDVLVAPGRPKGKRGSYIQHREGGVPPKVVFEVLSPSNTPAEMTRKGFFYQQHGVDEYILVDPEAQDGTAYVRNEHGNFAPVDTLDGWTSPFLGVRFAREAGQLKVYRPDGTLFSSFMELDAERAELAHAVEAERERADAERERADAERERADAERERAERLAAKLRELGIEPD